MAAAKTWKPEWKQDVVYLHVFPRIMSKGVPNFSPFAVKLETWLRISKIAFEVVDHMGMSTKGQSPFIMFNQKEYPDSNFIIEYLTDYFSVTMENCLSDVEKAISRAFLKMIEEDMTWSIFWYRYVDHFVDEYLEYLKPSDDPEKAKAFAEHLGSSVKNRAVSHGIGRHSNEEIYKIGSDDIRAISKYLGDKTFMMGDNPTLIDCCLFGFIIQITDVPINFPMRDVIEKECPNILQFVDRIKTKYWSDWNQQCI
ncbi:unnamed protein product [Mytilus coruscus]|uniref:Failed axon connections homolog n=1 Tax=Mytilus coruscus TaxID=42192 RepID=A0A6J8B122_MYTCO|nr:unnamed protein product [Mytilus coruscus]